MVLKMKNKKYLPLFISMGILLGLVGGIILSLLKGDLGLWVSVGAGFGMVFGSLWYVINSVKK